MQALKRMDNEVIQLFKRSKLKHTVIIVLFKGKKLPMYCVAMFRNPKPQVNVLLSNNRSLYSEYISQIKKNSAVKNGAVLIQLNRDALILRG